MGMGEKAIPLSFRRREFGIILNCILQTGKLQLYDIAAGVQLETIDAHEGAIWGLSLAPDKVSLDC